MCEMWLMHIIESVGRGLVVRYSVTRFEEESWCSVIRVCAIK